MNNSQLSILLSQLIPPGYKQTEAGVVPEDWLEHTVGELIDFEGGSQPDKSVFSPTQEPGFVRLIQIRDYKTDKFESYVPRNLARRFCDEDDIMIGRYGPPIFQILRGLSGAYNVALIKAKPHREINHDYAYYFLTQEKLFAFIEKLSQRSSGQTGIDLKELRGYPLPLPPTKAEQEAIAEALSDADALIESLEQLLAKKRQLKQGAMQELLTGKKRLPGFEVKPGYKQAEVGVIPVDWEAKTLGDIGESLIGLTYKPTDVRSDGILVLRSSNIQEATLRFDDNVFVDMEVPERIMVRVGDILICVRNGSRELIGKCTLLDERAKGMTFGAFMAVFRTPAYRFVYHQFQSAVLKRQIHEHLGATINQITNKSLNSFSIPLPRQEAEQTAIAAILSNMDEEIAALEGKLAKARQLKQGMMQELLTGRIRLI